LQKKQCTEQEVREGAEVIARNCRAQAQLLEDVLEVSRMSVAKLRLEVKPCDLASVIYAAIEVRATRAKCKQIAVTVAIDPSASPSVLRRTSAFNKSWWNLLSNAIKFTPRAGCVQVCWIAKSPRRASWSATMGKVLRLACSRRLRPLPTGRQQHSAKPRWLDWAFRLSDIS